MKKYIFLFFIILSVSSNSFAASSGSSNNSLSNYDKAAKLIDEAKKYEKNDKVKKANKRYKRALKYLVKSDKEKPNIPDTLNYLGFVTRKLGDYINGEKYYLKGLAIDPNHVGINEYLGELYVVTKRIDLAIKRLEVLEKCNCEEYKELKEIIEGKKESKY
tara:strand:+ start:1788 stop:2270 length:483 start_codon:yes stop_codon:yes gene_type:complete